MVRFSTMRPFAAMFLITLTFNLLLTWVLVDRRQQIELVKLESIARSQSDNLQNELLRLVFKMETLNALAISKKGNIEGFDHVSSVLRDENTIKAFVLAPGGIISNVFPHTPDNYLLLGQDILANSLGSQEVAAARHAPRMTLTGPVKLPSGDTSLVGRLSIYTPDDQGSPQYWGTAAIFLQFPDVLSISDLYMLSSINIDFGLWRNSAQSNELQLLAGSEDSKENARSVLMPATILNARWTLRLSSGQLWYHSLEPWLYVGMGVLISLFLATLVQRNHDLTLIRAYLEAIAYKDALTDSLNRRGLFEELNRRLSVLAPSKFTLYYIDLNKFKSINDNYGHEAGDRVLQLFAELVRKHFPEAHMLGRVGGDEFVLLLNGPPAHEQDAAAFARVREDMADGLPDLNVPGPITFSIGSAVYPDAALTADALLSCADAAMYQDKERAKALDRKNSG